jgi:uncharacterized iron-regulated membrane protein
VVDAVATVHTTTRFENRTAMPSPAFWRKWHRWIALPAALFLCFAAVTGTLVAGTEFFGEAEAEREALRDVVSPVTLRALPDSISEPLAKAFAAAAASAGDVPVDQVTIAFKGDHPTVTIYTGKPAGGEDRKLVLDARTGALLRVEAYADKPFLYRLHSGEAFGDGGLVAAMLWGTALALLSFSGFLIYGRMYSRMRHRGTTGIRRVFW